MRILFITHVSNMAGANRSMLQLIKELKADYQVEIVTLIPKADNHKGGIQEFLEKLNIPFVTTEIRFFKREKPTLRNVLGYVRYLWRQRHLYKQLLPYHFDIIHSNSSVIDIGGYLSKKLGAKHVWHLREFGDSDYDLEPIGGKVYERYTYQHADAFIAISKAVANHFKNKVEQSKIHTIYNGIFIPKDAPISKHDNISIQFFCAGLICEGKNQKEIVLALDVLNNVRHINKSCHLTLVGIHTQPYTDQLIALISEKHLGEHVTILPEANGIQSLAASMDVGIMCSKSEAFGRVTVEYQLQNLLVIANDAGANCELIEDMKTGLLYKKGDYHSLADKMQWAIEHLQDLKQISQSGMENAMRNFTSKKNTREIYHLYQELIKGL